MLTAASTLFTYQQQHEQMEALGASVVDHLASSKCTAITKSLAALAVARSDVLNGERKDERTETAASTVIGVVTPSSWTLEDYHAAAIRPAQALAVLRQLPGQALQDARPGPLSQALPSHLDAHRCSLGYGLNPAAVRIYAIPSPHGAPAPRGGSSAWVALLYGPWPAQGQQKTAFALVNLPAATVAASGHNHSLDDLLPGRSGQLAMRVEVRPAELRTEALTVHRATPLLDVEDQKLLGLKLVPFANGLLRSELSVDHNRLDRGPRRSAALVFLIGLLATSAVVLVSRRTETRLRQLNQALLQESRSDGLTRLANRRAWDEALLQEEERRRRYGQRYGLVVVDLDGFKVINDQQGHQAGDQVLQMAAVQLARQLRGSDVLARVGGDEFAMLIVNPTPEGLNDLIGRLRTALTEAGIQASIGGALSEAQATLDQTWAQADVAMYAVKAASPEAQPSPIQQP